MGRTFKFIGAGLGAVLLLVALAGAAFAAGRWGGPERATIGGVDQGPDGQASGPSRGGRPYGLGPFGGPGMGGVLPPMLMQRLDLTAEQKDRLTSIVGAHQEEGKTLGERAKTARQALDAAVGGDSFDEATVRMRSAEVAAVDADMAVLRARIFNETFQILTPAQQSKLKDMRSAMRAREQKWHDHRQDRRGPAAR